MHQYRAFSHIQHGRRHIESGAPCQDFALANDAAPNSSVIVVADGHGSADCFRSDRGARFAVQATASALMEFASEMLVDPLRDPATRRGLMRALFDGILSRWHEAIQADLFHDPIEENQMESVSQAARMQYLSGTGLHRAYGTTLIAVLITERYFLGLQQGDGRCIAVRTDGSCEQPIPWDVRCEASRTTSLGGSNALEEFRHCFSEDLPAAVFLCTDGVDAAYPDINGVYGLCQSLSLVYLEDGYPGLARAAEEELQAMHHRGNGDDVTLAGLLCADQLAPITAVLQLEMQLRQISALWDETGREAKEHDAQYLEAGRTLGRQSAAVTQIESEIAQLELELAQGTERLRALEQALGQKHEELSALIAALEQKRREQSEAAQTNAQMEAEQKRLQLALSEVETETRHLTGALQKARQQAAEQPQAHAPDAQPPATEDFTEPWAFVNHPREKDQDAEDQTKSV